MIRSASKNYKHVIVIANPKRYEFIIEELKANRNDISENICDLNSPSKRSGVPVVMTGLSPIILTASIKKKRLSNSTLTGLHETTIFAIW